MATSKEQIRAWLTEGKARGATHVIIVCDTFDHDDYPVYVSPSEDAREIALRYNGQNMQRLMEVYNLHGDLEAQMNEHRAFNY